MKSTVTRRIEMPHGTTVEELRAALGTLPSRAEVAIRSTPGDRPWESSSDALEITYEEAS